MATEEIRANGFGLDEMVSAIDHQGTAFAALLRSLDPADGQRPVPHMKWTVAETAVHMLSIVRRGLGDTRRAGSIAGLAELNDLNLSEVFERDVHALADLIESDTRRYVDILKNASAERIAGRIVDLHAGVRADIPSALSYQLFDFLAHGWDIASAVGRTWTIDAANAILVLRAGLPALRPWVFDEILTGPPRRAAFTFPGFDAALIAATGEGAFTVVPAERDYADDEVDPVEMFLAVAGRVPVRAPLVKDLASWFRPI